MIMGGRSLVLSRKSLGSGFSKISGRSLQKQICNYVVTAGHFCDPDRKTRAFYLLLTDVYRIVKGLAPKRDADKP